MRVAGGFSQEIPVKAMIGEDPRSARTGAFEVASILAPLLLVGWKTLFAQSSNSPPVRIDRVVVAGNKITAPDVILREIPFSFPAVLSADELKIVENRVQNLRLFNRVELSLDEREGQNVLTVLVTESWYIFPTPVFFVGEHEPFGSFLFSTAGECPAMPAST